MPQEQAPKLTKTDLLVNDPSKLCNAFSADADNPAHRKQLAPGSATNQAASNLEKRLARNLVSAPKLHAAIRAGTPYTSDQYVEMVMRSVFLWLSAALATDALERRYAQGLEDHHAPQLYKRIMKHHRVPNAAQYRAAKLEYDALNAKPPALLVWQDVLRFTSQLLDIEDKCVRAKRPLQDADLFDLLVDTVENMLQFTFTVGSIRASDDHTFGSACVEIQQRCDALQAKSTTPQPNTYANLGKTASAGCAECGNANHTVDKCHKRHPHLRSKTACRNQAKGKECAYKPCPYKHTDPAPTSYFAETRLPSPPTEDAFNGQYSFYTTQATTPPPAYKNAETHPHEQDGSTAPPPPTNPHPHQQDGSTAPPPPTNTAPPTNARRLLAAYESVGLVLHNAVAEAGRFATREPAKLTMSLHLFVVWLLLIYVWDTIPTFQ
jgi:hypothetical protein